MAEQDSDRSEEATSYRLEEARKKGTVAKSQDFTAMAMQAALALVVLSTGWDMLRHGLRMQQKILAHAGQRNWSVDSVAAWCGELLLEFLSLLGPLLLALAVMAVVVNIFQTGPIFSLHPLKPDIDRINPASGIKRLFSLRTVFEAVKSLIKLAILGSVMYFLVRSAIPHFLGLPGLDAKGYAQILLLVCASMLLKMVLTLLVIAVIDLLYTRWEFGKRMRMSKRDIKDEHKNREGDPRIRARIRQLRQEVLARSKAMQKLPDADVLITNPTHLAVALSYQHGSSGAPQVIAKGAGDMAQNMRLLAARHGIPVVQNRALARTLFREVDYDAYVPEKLYPQLAKIMVWVYAMRQARQ